MGERLRSRTKEKEKEQGRWWQVEECVADTEVVKLTGEHSSQE